MACLRCVFRHNVVIISDVVPETKVLVSRRLEDKQLSLRLGLDKKSIKNSQDFPFSYS